MKEKVVLITGAAGGIGQATAQLFTRAQQNYLIVLIDHFSKVNELKKLNFELNNLLYGNKCTWFHCDITRDQEIETIIKHPLLQPLKIDALINIAGIAPATMTPLVKTDVEKIKTIMDVNFWGTLNMCKAVLPLMQTNGFGRIINISSISAFMADPGNLVYSASKAAVVQLTRALAKEAPFNKNGPPHDITVNAVAPGIVDTNMVHQLTDRMVDGFKGATPFGRLGTPEEIAKVIFWLASEAPQFLTGETIRVDGGFLA